MRGKFITALVALWLAAAPAQVNSQNIPTLSSIVGHETGAQISWPWQMESYFEALAKAAPDRMRLVTFGKSWEGRPLMYAVITSAKNMEKLDALQSDIQRLAAARLPVAEARALIKDMPVPVWLAYSVHGNEISPTDAAIKVAYTLLSSENDADIEAILDNVIVILDPLLNPDGRARFTQAFYSALGLAPSGSAIAAERREPWPNGRTNHYLFDMNRDWFALTQPETRSRVRAFLKWFPAIFVDLHEMGSNSTYYFSPEAEPYNPYITDNQRAGLLAIGKGNAAAFDAKGLEYYTREVFDAHYPGYGGGWPLFHGSIGTTYEQASARGLKADRDDGTTLTYAESVDGHFTSSMATLKTAAEKRSFFLQNFYDNRASAIALAKSSDIKAYVIPTQADQAGAGKLAGTLAYQGITVQQAAADFRACGQSFKAGSFIVPLNQPAGRLARTLLDTQVDVDPAFMKDQERRRKKGFGVEFYDVTAWSMPIMYNVDAVACKAAPSVKSRSIMPRDEWLPPPGKVNGADTASFGYLVPWGDAAAVRVLSRALSAGIDVRSSDLPFEKDGVTYPAGSLIFQRSKVGDGLDAFMTEATTVTGATATGMADSWVDEGPNFGSDNSVRHGPLKVAVAWDEPTVSYSAGGARFVIERQLGYPATPVRTAHLDSRYLSQFDVLVLPEGNGYVDVLGKAGMARLKAWTKDGGVLITLGNATRVLKAAEMSALELQKRPDADDGDTTVIADEAALDSAIAKDGGAPDSILGSFLKAEVNGDHWMAAGVKDSVNILTEGTDVYQPLRLDDGFTIARYAGPDDLLVSGYLWEEARKALAYKPAVTIESLGGGYVIAFAQDPTTRAYLDGLNMLLANAVFRAPAHADKIR
ncbi:MAG: M14 metallopeptidase family protein [Pseudomonadota bacterium]